MGDTEKQNDKLSIVGGSYRGETLHGLCSISDESYKENCFFLYCNEANIKIIPSKGHSNAALAFPYDKEATVDAVYKSNFSCGDPVSYKIPYDSVTEDRYVLCIVNLSSETVCSNQRPPRLQTLSTSAKVC